MTASAGVVRYPAEAFAKGGNSNESKLAVNPFTHFSITMIHQEPDFSYCQLSLFISDNTHNEFCDFW